ncbi:hypothetical protein H0G86_009220 [Trichoderma simmonsii]|uniref:Uncharacterized protein n=1 Tax=Trichoderma simmonsii TaxID=1491479 RepID=A0A8G0PMR7_9HYPO|nr:hypothetical protein H0G86_009220 [Trichoderma simmonsii]
MGISSYGDITGNIPDCLPFRGHICSLPCNRPQDHEGAMDGLTGMCHLTLALALVPLELGSGPGPSTIATSFRHVNKKWVLVFRLRKGVGGSLDGEKFLCASKQ